MKFMKDEEGKVYATKQDIKERWNMERLLHVY